MKPRRANLFTHILCLVPIITALVQFFLGRATANPIQFFIHRLGRSSIYFLLLSLLCRPLFTITKMGMFMTFRKILGLYAFYYAFSHFLVFIFFDYELNFLWIIDEISQKPFLKIGLIALFGLAIMAITSFRKLRTKLGKHWNIIHKMVYGYALLIIIHIFQSSKGDYLQSLLLLLLLSIMLILRLPFVIALQAEYSPAWLIKINAYFMKQK